MPGDQKPDCSGTADQGLGPPPPVPTQNENTAGRTRHSIRRAYAGLSPGLVRTANSCAIVQFLEKDSFLPNKRKKIPLWFM